MFRRRGMTCTKNGAAKDNRNTQRSDHLILGRRMSRVNLQPVEAATNRSAETAAGKTQLLFDRRPHPRPGAGKAPDPARMGNSSTDVFGNRGPTGFRSPDLLESRTSGLPQRRPRREKLRHRDRERRGAARSQGIGCVINHAAEPTKTGVIIRPPPRQVGNGMSDQVSPSVVLGTKVLKGESSGNEARWSAPGLFLPVGVPCRLSCPGRRPGFPEARSFLPGRPLAVC